MKRFSWPVKGKADKRNMIIGSQYRFTVLNEGLIRMEYSPDGVFEDEATQQIFYRNFKKADFKVRETAKVLTIETKNYTLTYQKNKPFSKKTLSISLRVKPYTEYRFGEPLQNLKGTRRTLDHGDGPMELSDGVLSRDGIAFIDDSESLLLRNDWFSVRKKETDIYGFIFGHDYEKAIQSLTSLTGAMPLLPAYALGNWWSRYHKYTEQEYKDLIHRFEKENCPFSVAVIDMDWHTTENLPEESKWDTVTKKYGWTGYSWNREYFPDYKRFLKFLHDHHMATTLNLHPAQGVCCHEDMYEEMARACGVDKKTKAPVKLDILNPSFMEKYFDILHHPYEENGVDFWWMDWQQGTSYWWIHDKDHPKSDLEQMDPLWLLNHLHILDIKRNGKRPMFFSRYAGIGSQRYPIGFSGDTVINWETLDFQPYFTNTASNVAYGWWSHDIGGHMRGYRDAELATRWLQYGVFSPINRLHSSSEEFTGKEPWKFGPEAEEVQKHFLRLRHQLFPYLYTMNHRSHKTGIPIITPMYYAYPEAYEAYEVPNQYFFGTELMVAPITKPSAKATGLGSTEVWFPEGRWFDIFTGFYYEGNSRKAVHRKLSEYPVFAKEGAILVMQKENKNNILGNQKDLEIHIFPGKNGSFTLLEDEGDGDGFLKGKRTETKISLKWGKKPVITIDGAKGDTKILPKERNYRIFVHSVSRDVKAEGVTVCGNQYDDKTGTLEVSLRDVPVNKGITLTLSGSELSDVKKMAEERIKDILTFSKVSNIWKEDVRNTLPKYPIYEKSGPDERTVSVAIFEMREFLHFTNDVRNTHKAY